MANGSAKKRSAGASTTRNPSRTKLSFWGTNSLEFVRYAMNQCGSRPAYTIRRRSERKAFLPKKAAICMLLGPLEGCVLSASGSFPCRARNGASPAASSRRDFNSNAGAVQYGTVLFRPSDQPSSFEANPVVIALGGHVPGSRYSQSDLFTDSRRYSPQKYEDSSIPGLNRRNRKLPPPIPVSGISSVSQTNTSVLANARSIGRTSAISAVKSTSSKGSGT